MKEPVTLYQVHVTDTDAGHDVPIGPAMDSAEPLHDFAAATNLAILKGKIHGWKDARVVSFVKQTH
jgi:hypothetical protein